MAMDGIQTITLSAAASALMMISRPTSGAIEISMPIIALNILKGYNFESRYATHIVKEMEPFD